MSWIEIVPVFTCALALAVVPGGLLAYAAGGRNYYLLGLAAPLSISIIALSAILAAPLSIRFGLLPVLVVTALSCVAAIAIRTLLGRPVTSAAPVGGQIRAHRVVAPSGVAIAYVLIASNFAKLIERPDNFSQTYDNIFHMSAVRYIVESGVGTSLTMGTLGTGPDVFYPAAWHDFVALVHVSTGSTIPVAITASSLTIGAFIWPASCVFLAAVVFGSRPLIILGTAVLSAGFSSFPYLMISFGVLYPYLLALALLPAAIALLADLFRIGTPRAPSDFRIIALLLAAILPGLALAHPSALLFLMLLAVCLAPIPFIRRILDAARPRRKISTAAVAAVVLSVSVYALVSIWAIARPTRGASFWPPNQTAAQAVGEIATLAPMRAPIAWVLLAMLLIGIYSAFRQRLHRWALIPLLAGSFLYVVVTSFPNDDLRYFITGVWYNDSYRLAALLPIALLPIVLVGWRALGHEYEQQMLRRIPKESRQSRSTMVGINAIAVVLLIAITQGDAVTYAVRSGSQNYGVGEDSPLISADEAALLEQIPQLVPESATVVGNPYTGASLVYALADRTTPSPHVGQGLNLQDQVLINELDEMLTNPAVCPVVEELGDVYVLDFGAEEIHGGDHPFPGTDKVSPATGFNLVAREGDASLWEVVGCNSEGG